MVIQNQSKNIVNLSREYKNNCTYFKHFEKKTSLPNNTLSIQNSHKILS